MAWGGARVNSHKGLLFGNVVPFIQSTLTGGTDEGKPVEITAAKTVALCSSDGDAIHGFITSIGAGICSVQLKGFIETAYSGFQNPVIGREYLCSDGAGKVRCGDTAAVGTITLSAVPEGRAQGTITLTDLPDADGTITIDTITFTFKASATSATEITIGGDVDTCVANIAAKINAHPTLSLIVGAAAAPASDTVVVTAKAHTVATDSIVFSESATNLTMDGSGTLGETRAGATNTFVIGSTTFTFVTLRAAAGQVTVGASVDATLVNIETAINTDMTTVHAVDDADTDTVAISAVTAGTAGNAIIFTESSNNLTIDGSGTLGGTTAGADGTAGREFLITNVDTALKVVTFFFKQ